MASPHLLRHNSTTLRRAVAGHWMRKANLVLAIAWAFMIPISVATGWIYSIAFISAASIYANFISHIAAWRADVPDDES